MIGIQQCFTCEHPVNPNTVHTRFGHKFCSSECLDVFDERNDYAHEQKYYDHYEDKLQREESQL
jgi:recombinational DNA repair protein (RecF pathway)